MSDTPETQEAVERWRQGKINIFDEMARLEIERNSLQDQRDFCMGEIERLRKERDEALAKIERQAERIRYLEGATNHACGTPLSVALRERDKAREAWLEAFGRCNLCEQQLDEARKQLRVAVGLLSTTPQFQDQHPEEVLKCIEEAAK